MSSHPETNPHFIKAPLQKREGQPSRTPTSHGGVSPGRQEQQNQQPQAPPETRSRNRGQGSKKKGGASVVQPKHGGEFRSPWTAPAQQHPGQHPDSNFPLHESQVQIPPTQPPPKLQNKSSLPHFPLHPGDFQSPWAFQPQPRGQQYQPYDPKHDREPQVPPPGNQDQDRGPGMTHPQHQEQPRRATGHGVGQAHFSGLPKPGGTKPIIWLGAVFCAILWIVIFLGGLIVLVVYLVYRPRSPRFDVSSATLNTAYIDAGSLLNADLSVLANFTNPNKKVSVDFSYMVIDLYYGSTLIATQYIEPFSAERAESRFVNVHMVTSQVRLPVLESERLQEQISKNGAIFAVKGVFRVRSKLGTLLKYSYRLYGHCTIMVTAPPDGVLRATKCRTKR
ncbi:PROLINE-RICH RECEPTOR-LIKE KINASE [Salix koriyanagi]|uniref:PROLINE-RICH RECEPTOR-LIKE KINASE n=1 Tax=Salix koriyanagi TaxID=2511006 RepID=A0A9Q0WQ79_9ROSI|nr:PROLINE-RICH RECEPTOR-LIKE KINASE [Salix koriyanagi]